MLGHELGVQQLVAPRDQPRHQMDQRHLAGVAGEGDHALAEEGAAQADAVEAAHQLAVRARPRRCGPGRAGRAPCRGALIGPLIQVSGRLGRACGAGVQHRLEGGVDPHLEPVRAHGAGQPAGHVEVARAGSGPARSGSIRKISIVLAGIGHREDAAP